MSLHIHNHLLCSAERAALERKAQLRRSHLNFIMMVLTMFVVCMGIGAIASLADIPLPIGIIVVILWSVWLTRLLLNQRPITPHASASVMPPAVEQVRDQSVAVRAATIEECAHQVDLMAGEMFADGETYHFIARALRERMLTPDAVNQVTTVTPVNQCQSVSSVRASVPSVPPHH